MTLGIRARMCDLRLGIQPALGGMKHLNRLEQVMARGEWDDPAITRASCWTVKTTSSVGFLQIFSWSSQGVC